MSPQTGAAAQLERALKHPDASARLESAMAAGTRPGRHLISVLVNRCALEPDFYVREMLTWALTQQDRDLSITHVLQELDSPRQQARSQALHTLSKFGDARAWPAITHELLTDEDDEVAKAAWRAAAALAPDGHRKALAQTLATQFARGGESGIEIQASLARAFQ